MKTSMQCPSGTQCTPLLSPASKRHVHVGNGRAEGGIGLRFADSFVPILGYDCPFRKGRKYVRKEGVKGSFVGGGCDMHAPCRAPLSS